MTKKKKMDLFNVVTEKEYERLREQGSELYFAKLDEKREKILKSGKKSISKIRKGSKARKLKTLQLKHKLAKFDYDVSKESLIWMEEDGSYDDFDMDFTSEYSQKYKKTMDKYNKQIQSLKKK